MLLWQYQNNRSISSDTTHYLILSIYILICVAAIIANSLIVWAVIRNKKVCTKLSTFYSQKNSYYILSCAFHVVTDIYTYIKTLLGPHTPKCINI